MYENAAAALPVDVRERVALPLETLVTTLDAAVREVVGESAHRHITTVALAESSDLETTGSLTPRVDLVMPVGVTAEVTKAWLQALALRERSLRPVAAIIKEEIDSVSLREAAGAAEMVLVVVDQMARWDLLFSAVHRKLERAQSRPSGEEVLGSREPFTDLADLASVIAAGAGGMVTIERPDSSMLAYSPSDGTADALRERAILGRVAPDDSMVLLGKWGVVAKIQQTRDVVLVPAHADLGMRPRLVTGIHSPTGQFIGSIWVQEGAHGFSADAETVVRGGAAAAARVLMREMDAPTATEMMLQRVFGERGGVDAGTAAAFLELPTLGEAAVMGISGGSRLPQIAKILRLHIASFAPQGRFTLLGERAYVLLPHLTASHMLEDWAQLLVAKFDREAASDDELLRAAVVTPVAGLGDVADARAEADRVLDAIGGGPKRVTSLTQSRTSVLLREAVEALKGYAELADPRMEVLASYDSQHRADLVSALDAYVRSGFNAREAARTQGIHANTLRYRLARAEELTGFDLGSPPDRLLISLQLEMRRSLD